MTADEVKRALNLRAHPAEGGFFAETYRSAVQLPVELADAAGLAPRPLATAIYYLLTPETFSEMHRLRFDEIFHFYLGDAVEMLQLFPDGAGTKVRIGANIEAGERPQVLVPAGVWQGTRLAAGGRLALLGTTMSPGFDYADYSAGQRDELVRAYPQFREAIVARTGD